MDGDLERRDAVRGMLEDHRAGLAVDRLCVVWSKRDHLPELYSAAFGAGRRIAGVMRSQAGTMAGEPPEELTVSLRQSFAPD